MGGMRRRYRGPILWIGLGVIVILAYVLSQPVPISTEGYRPPEVATPATDPLTTADATAAGIAAVTPPVAEAAPAAAVTPEPVAVATPQPAPLPTPAPAPVATTQAMFVNATSLNLRAAPEAGAAVLEVLPRGTRVDALGEQNGWREVVNPATGMRGWMSAEFLTTTGPAAAPAAAATPAETPGAAPATPGLVLLPN